MAWPEQLTINACTKDGPVKSAVRSEAQRLVRRKKPPDVDFFLRPPSDPNPADWSDPRVGWGLILPERDNLSEEQLALASDAPEPIQALLEARRNILRERGGDAPVFRYRQHSRNNITLLRKYGSKIDKAIHPGAEQGTAPQALPRYLLIYGTPQEIPWELQYSLNTTSFVGRLDLQDAALQNYVSALLNDWKNSTMQVDHAVIWAVDHGADDITRLMRNAIANKVYEDLNGDEHLHGKTVFLDGTLGQASSDSLLQSLTEQRPSLVVTTSHGQTDFFPDAAALKQTLGLLVDQNFKVLQPEHVLEKWAPDGAIWYAHACCSAGTSDGTLYEGLVEADSQINQVLKAVTAFGAFTAPLPRALLGATQPLRAFVGHVEPTFDWTLRQPQTKEHLTWPLRRALYNNLYRSMPIGLAFAGCYTPLATLKVLYDTADRRFNQGEDTSETMLYCNLTARDLQSMVILGDPAAALPALI